MDQFYNQKFNDAARRLKALQNPHGSSLQAESLALGTDDVADLLGALLELRNALRKLQWFGEVNRRGFVKITKKLDKKVPDHGQPKYVESQVAVKPFATNAELGKLMNETNDLVEKLGALPKADSNSDARSGTLTRGSSKSMLGLSQDDLDSVDKALRKDAVSALRVELDVAEKNMTEPPDGSFQALVLDLLQRAIIYRSRKCIAELLKLTPTLDAKDDINQRNCLHRFLVSLNRSQEADDHADPKPDAFETVANGDFITPAATPNLTSYKNFAEEEGSQYLGKEDDSVKLFSFLLDSLSVEQRTALQARDHLDRLPLHYAAQYGYVILVQTILTHMQQWGQFEIDHGVDAPFWQDLEGLSPLGLSIVGGHVMTTKALLQSEAWRERKGGNPSLKTRMGRSGEALALATKRNFVEAVRLLLEAGVDTNYQDPMGETALHVAARFGHVKCAKLLLSGSGASDRALANIVEVTFGWTPLFVACVDGHFNMVQLLVDAGADPSLADASGWTAREHAAFRGNIDIARALAALTPPPQPSSTRSDPPSSTSRKQDGEAQAHVPPSVKSFGHRFLTDSSMVLVRLGSSDARTNMPVVKLNRIPLVEAHRTQLDTALSLIVHAVGAEGEPFIADLPAQENEPITFTTKDAAAVKLYFDIVPTYAGSHEPVLGRGVAMLGSVRPGIGDMRTGLRGDVCVPIMAAQGLEVLGEVRFNFQVVTPFKHKNLEITEKHTYWKSMASTTLIGHRGLGKNQQVRRSLQLGENTIQSFIAAANLGASYVEFDVQLTKDHVPVIYHDFLVSETGIDAPMHTLTLAQFHHISNSRTSRLSQSDSSEGDPRDAPVARSAPTNKGRSLSLGNTDDLATPAAMNERMKHTHDFKKKGFKANSRGSSIQAPFATLADLFAKLDPSLGFNIECKYPMLHEAEEHGMDAYAVELNAFADAVLTAVYDRLAGAGAARHIIFSSFNPDLCVLLALKQPSIPILFLTDAGCEPNISDTRASSLQEAIRFASRWNLLGIVSAAEPLVRCPRLVRAVKESGLVCVSYGALNNDPDNVKVCSAQPLWRPTWPLCMLRMLVLINPLQLQVQEGIDAVIVDSVLAIRQGLTGNEGKASMNGTQHADEAERLVSLQEDQAPTAVESVGS